MKRVRVTLDLPIVIEGVGSVFEQHTVHDEAYADTEMFNQWVKSVMESLLFRLMDKLEFKVQVIDHDPDHFEFFLTDGKAPRADDNG